MDMQRSQPPPTSVVMTTTTEASNPPTPTSVFQHVIVQPGHLVQIPKTQPSREENSKNNGVLCKFETHILHSNLDSVIIFFFSSCIIKHLYFN